MDNKILEDSLYEKVKRLEKENQELKTELKSNDVLIGTLYDEKEELKNKLVILKNYFSANLPDGEKIFDVLTK